MNRVIGLPERMARLGRGTRCPKLHLVVHGFERVTVAVSTCLQFPDPFREYHYAFLVFCYPHHHPHDNNRSVTTTFIITPTITFCHA